MVKKTKSRNNKNGGDLPKNKTIIIAIFLLVVGYYAWNNPITTGLIMFLLLTLGIIMAAGYFFGSGRLLNLLKLR